MRTISHLSSKVKLRDDDDQTKNVQFDVSGVSTGNTRTVSFPDHHLTVAGVDTPQVMTNKTIDATQNSITNVGDAEIIAGIDASKLADGSVSNAELQHLNGVTSPLQTQLNAKADVNHTHVATDITDFNAAADARIALQKATANGLATLNASGKLPASQMPLGGLLYLGTWNAATNSPTITGGSGTQGHYYVVSVAGNTNIDGETDWNLRDHIVFNGLNWEKSDHSDSVTSVAGRQGAVSLVASDIEPGETFADNLISLSSVKQHEANLDVTSMSNAPGSPYVGTTDVQTLTNKTLDASQNNLSNIPSTAIHDGSVSNDEFGYLNGLTGPIQQQFNQLRTESTVTTNDANVTTIVSIPTQNDTTYKLKVEVVARRTSGAQSAGFEINAVYRNNGGVLTLLPRDRLSIEDNFEWNTDVSVSGTNMIVQVTGVASTTINWKCVYTYISV